MELNHFALHLKHCKSTTLQLKMKKGKNKQKTPTPKLLLESPSLGAHLLLFLHLPSLRPGQPSLPTMPPILALTSDARVSAFQSLAWAHLPFKS